MPSPDLERDRLPDPIVAAPRPRWLTARRTIFRLGFAIFWVAAGIYLLRELRFDRSTSSSHLLFGTLATVVCFSLATVELLILKLAWKRPFAIVHAGIELLGHTILWENITSCRWNIYSPGALMINTHVGNANGRHTVAVPESRRALVEATLRRFGKWDGAQSPLAPYVTTSFPG